MEKDVDQIMTRIREEVRRRKSGAASETAPSQVSTRPLQDPVLENPSAQDLLRLRDTEFVRNAYRAILKREADPHGLGEYVRTLRECTLTKEDILQSLARSDEGRTKKADISGLRSVIRKNRIRHLLKDKIPVVRSIVRWALPLFNLAKVVRRIDSLEGTLEARLAEQNTLLELAFSRHITDLQVLHEKARVAEMMRTETDSRFATLNRRIEDQQVEFHRLSGRSEEFRNDFLSLNHIVQVELRQELESLFSGFDQRTDALKKDFLNLNHIVVVGHSERLNAAEKLHARLEQMLLDYRTSLLDQERRLAILLQEARKRMPAPLDQKQLASMVSEETHLLDAMYVAFEDRFRGTREDIKRRVTVYVERVRAAGLGSASKPVLDIGCGRGEWLEVLRDQGLVARGIDLNRVMVSQCHERGLDVQEIDAIEALRATPTASVGVVSGFHIIEHLPLGVMISMFDEALRVLVPGGFVLFETPNPENLITAASNFYYDPTHRNPLPPPLVQFLAEARGFTRVEIVRLHPLATYHESLTIPSELRTLLGAAQDYSVVGFKA